MKSLAVVTVVVACMGFAGCQRKPDASSSANVASEPSPASVVTVAPSVGVEEPTRTNPLAPDYGAQLRLETERRKLCSSAPISPSADELPYLGDYRHEVHASKRDEHVFLPPYGKFFDVSRLDSNLKALHARFPDLGNLSMQRCGNESHRGKIPKPMCVHLEVPICEPWLPKAERLIPALAPEGLALLVSIVGRVGPRCTGDACRPVGYRERIPPREELTWSGVFTLPYRAAEPRTPLMSELGEGVCTSDGDCDINGCGNHCEAWTVPPHGATCPAYAELADAYCGCVANACTWFGQTPVLDVKAQVTVSGWPDTFATTRVNDSKPGDVVLREALEASWFRRQLERVTNERGVTVPREFASSLTLDRKFQVASADVTVDGKAGPDWLREILQHLPIPVPELPKSAPRPAVRVEARVNVRSR